MSYLVLLAAFCILSISFPPSIVKAATQPTIPKRQARKQHGLELEEFINKVIKEGEDDKMGPNISRDLGLDPDHNSKLFERVRDECVDGRDRAANVVVEKVLKSDRLKSISVVFLAQKVWQGASESYYFKIKPDGAIEKAFRNSGKVNPDGHGVPGSGINVDLEPDEAQRLLKRELDFWLRGIGLKKKPAETAKKDAVKAATEPATKSEVPFKTEVPAKPATK